MTTEPLLAALPDDARLWIHTADRLLTADEQRTLDRDMHAFFEGWTSHGRPVVGDHAVLDDRFVLVGALVPDGDVSGCGIDKLIRQLTARADAMGVDWLSPLRVLYRDAEGVPRDVSRSGFKQRVAEGRVTPATPVFDPSVTTVGALRDGAFEQPASASWHARAFPALQSA